MIPVEHRQTAIWAGGGLVAVILAYGAFLSPLADERAVADAQLAGEHAAYKTWYGDGDQPPPGKTREEALAEATKASQRQRDELESVEATTLCRPGGNRDGLAPEFVDAGTGRIFDFSAGTTFAKAQSLVGEVNTRLSGRARKMGMTFPDQLPYQQKGEIQAGDGDKDKSLRGLQLAEVCAYASLADLVLEVLEYNDRFRKITRLQVGGPSKRWRSADRRYAVVLASLEIECGYPSTDQILRRLEANRAGLGLWSVEVEQREDLSQRLLLTAALTIENLQSVWDLPELPVVRPTGRPGATAPTPTTTPSTGASRRRP